MKRVFGILALLVAVVAIATLAIWGFIEGRDAANLEAERDKVMRPAPRKTIVHGEPVIILDPAAQQQGGMQIFTLVPALHQHQLRAYGAVADLQQLTELSNNYANAKSQLQTAQAKLGLSKAGFERAQALYRGSPQTISLAQLQTAEATFHVDQASVAATDSAVRALTQVAVQVWGPVLARALIEQAPILTRLIERQDVLVQLTLQPGELVTTPPTSAFAQLDRGSRINLQYTSAAAKTDARIQGPSFFYTAPAESGLQPGMNVLAFVASEQQLTGAIVPASAVVWLQGRSWVYLQTGPSSFVRREIATDRPASGGGYLVQDLPQQDRVVTQGAQMLLSEEFRAQIRVGD
jgi:hypothetical protein